MSRVLIVAYGNPLRSDDGVAWRAADALEGKFSESDVEILRLHQLGPELAETASRFEYVIFIDAATGGSRLPGEIRIEEMRLAGRIESSRFSHVVTPRTVVTLATALYGATPKAILVTMAGASFDHGDKLSPPVEAALSVLVAKIEGLIRSLGAAERPMEHGD